jgi:hypothetical protein
VADDPSDALPRVRMSEPEPPAKPSRPENPREQRIMTRVTKMTAPAVSVVKKRTPCKQSQKSENRESNVYGRNEQFSSSMAMTAASAMMAESFETADGVKTAG